MTLIDSCTIYLTLLFILKTKFDEMRIQKWYQAFNKECPEGKLTREHLIKLFKKVFPQGDGEVFCDHIFRVFDDDSNNTLEFRVRYGFCLLLEKVFKTFIGYIFIRI